MRICFYVENVFPSVGGTGQTIERFSKALQKKGHTIVIICTKRKGYKNDFEIIDGIRIYRLNSLKIPFLGGKYYQGFPDPVRIKKIIQKEKIDIGSILPYAWNRFFIKTIFKNENIPIFFWLHFQPENITNYLRLEYSFIKKVIYFWIKFLVKSSDQVIVPSFFAKKMLITNGVKKNIQIISNGINFDVFNKKNADQKGFRKKFGLKNYKLLLFSGRLERSKNIDFLINSVSKLDWRKKELKNVKIIIVGDGTQKETLMKLCSKLGLNNRIIFLGRLSDFDLKSAYLSCEFFVFPSLVELEGIVVLEAMSFGKPVLVGNSVTSASTYLVEKGVNGFLFDLSKYKDLNKKIIKLLSDKKLLKKLSKNSSKKIKSYDINNSVILFERVLKRMIKRK